MEDVQLLVETLQGKVSFDYKSDKTGAAHLYY
jgi:hypothetical protein